MIQAPLFSPAQASPLDVSTTQYMQLVIKYSYHTVLAYPPVCTHKVSCKVSRTPRLERERRKAEPHSPTPPAPCPALLYLALAGRLPTPQKADVFLSLSLSLSLPPSIFSEREKVTLPSQGGSVVDGHRRGSSAHRRPPLRPRIHRPPLRGWYGSSSTLPPPAGPTIRDGPERLTTIYIPCCEQFVLFYHVGQLRRSTRTRKGVLTDHRCSCLRDTTYVQKLANEPIYG